MIECALSAPTTNRESDHHEPRIVSYLTLRASTSEILEVPHQEDSSGRRRRAQSEMGFGASDPEERDRAHWYGRAIRSAIGRVRR